MTSRVMALNQRKHRVIGPMYKSVYLEKITKVAGSSSIRMGLPETTLSLKVDPSPIIRTVTEEDTAVLGKNVAVGDYIIEILGSSVTEQDLENINQVVLNKGLTDQTKLQVLQYGPAQWIWGKDGFAIQNGEVVRWSVHVRGAFSEGKS